MKAACVRDIFRNVSYISAHGYTYRNVSFKCPWALNPLVLMYCSEDTGPGVAAVCANHAGVRKWLWSGLNNTWWSHEVDKRFSELVST